MNGTLDLSGTDIVLHPDKTELGKAQISVTIAGAPHYTLTIADSANGSITVVNATETAEDGKPLFYDEKGYAGLSDLARWYIGGLIKHSSSVLAFTNPSLNSYHRLVPGFEAPVNLVYSARNRSAAIRIPLAGTSPAAKRIEFRAPDPSCNPFLAFSAQLMAGLDGILNHIEPPEPVDKDLYELPPEEHAGIKQVPSSLAEAMDALEEDHDFLTAGDVFTDDLIETWIGLKRDEIDQARLAPTPLEYELYFHI